MFETAVRVKELISSNIDAVVAKASDPAKMRRLLRTEIEEKLISLQGEMARLRRNADRISADAEREAVEAEGWTGKAKLAMDHGREDLARQALMAREGGRVRAGELEQKATAMAAEGAELADLIAALEAKHAQLIGQGGGVVAPASDGEEIVDERLSRITRLESRIAFMTAAREAEGVDPDAIEAELAELQRDKSIEAELAEMRPAKTAPKNKPAARSKAK